VYNQEIILLTLFPYTVSNLSYICKYNYIRYFGVNSVHVQILVKLYTYSIRKCFVLSNFKGFLPVYLQESFSVVLDKSMGHIFRPEECFLYGESGDKCYYDGKPSVKNQRRFL